MLERIRTSIINGYFKDTQELITLALEEGISPETILEQAFLPAMNTVEEFYKADSLGIPNILASARCMKKGLELLQPHFANPFYHPLAKVLIGTVAGDLHDMGKNLVSIMFQSYGFEVIDLGVDVSEKQFLAALKQHPDVSLVCISSLLTTTMKEMQQIVKAIRRYDTRHRIKIMVGGGPVTQEFADAIGADGYTDNAIDAARFAKELLSQEDL